jgi:hypothetical protein
MEVSQKIELYTDQGRGAQGDALAKVTNRKYGYYEGHRETQPGLTNQPCAAWRVHFITTTLHRTKPWALEYEDLLMVPQV